MPLLASSHRFFKKLYLFLSIALLGLLYGCGGGTDSGSDPDPGVDINPPAGLVYAVSSASYAQHQTITPNVPHNSGGKITGYSVEPALPVGLVLDAVSGVISGTPVEAAPAVIHTVTGSNAHGAATAYLQIEVTAAIAAPTLLRYKENPVSYPVNVDINPNLPYTEGGAVTQFRSSPALPDGLQLDPSTGVISGASSTAKPAATYVISASNAAGAVSRALTIGITDSLQPPKSLTYSQPVAIYPQGKVIAPNLPTATGGAIIEFDVQPSLPEGLSLNTDSGEISGTPTTLQAAQTYTVTGSNAAGSASATIAITIAGPGMFYPGADINHARFNHTATPLPGGKVLIVGGQAITGGAIFDTAELYDPSTGLWTLTGSMSSPRSNHTATQLSDGKVLVTGGNAIGTAEIYDPKTGLWADTGAMNRHRSGHTATLLPNGKVLIVGGGSFSASADTAELYDPETNIWAFTGSMKKPRYRNHTAVLLENSGKVLVTGGAPSFGGLAQAAAELYDFNTETWTSTGDMNNARYNHAITVLQNGKVLVLGGYDASNVSLNTAEVYDPNAPGGGAWALTKPSAYKHTSPTLTTLDNGKVLATPGGGVAKPELYDSSTDDWVPTGHLNFSRGGHTATLLEDGEVLIVGGVNTVLTSELYIP
jgi:hypothetical protein